MNAKMIRREAFGENSREVAVYLNDVQAWQTLQQWLGKDAQSRTNLDYPVLGLGVDRGEDLRYDPAID
jgi:hypothetical protein